MSYLLLDIGGTKMRIGFSTDGKELKDVKIIKTPKHIDEAILLTKAYLNEKQIPSNDLKVCCGLPGIIDKDRSKLISAPNLPFWIDKPLKDLIKEVTGALNVFLENDAALAGLGEAVFGAGKEDEIVAYLTFGTGIGGVRIVSKKIDIHRWGFEPGHQIIYVDGGITAKTTDLEGLASGTGIERTYGKDPENIEEKEVWEKVERYISAAVTNTLMYWSPDIIVLGGGIIESGRINRENIIKMVSERKSVIPELPQIETWLLKDHAALFGGLYVLTGKT